MGNPFVHIDLSTSDLDAAKKFYRAVFDWKLQDFPQMNWTGIDVGPGGAGGGMGKKQKPEEPTAWTPYVGVDDVKKTIAKAQKAGATIVVPWMEVPGMGYLGVFVDPQGATIGVWQNAARAEAPPPAKEAAKPAQKAPAKEAAKPAQKAPAKAAAKPAQKAAAKPAQKALPPGKPAQKALPAKPAKKK